MPRENESQCIWEIYFNNSTIMRFDSLGYKSKSLEYGIRFDGWDESTKTTTEYFIPFTSICYVKSIVTRAKESESFDANTILEPLRKAVGLTE